MYQEVDLFSCEVFRLVLRIESLTVLPPYKGAVFRGALGNTLRRLVCAISHDDCNGCRLDKKCLYKAVFEPAPPDGFADAGKFSNATPPYVLTPPVTNKQAFHAGDTLEFEMTLIGPALDALPYLVYAFCRIGQNGLGKERGRFFLERVDLVRNGNTHTMFEGKDQMLKSLPPPDHPRGNSDTPNPAVEALSLSLKTPLRIKQHGTLVTRLDFATLFNSLAQRLTRLASFYGSGNGIPDFSDLLSLARDVRTREDTTFWYDWHRYSSRQKELMKFGGLRGEIVFTGNLTAFLPWLMCGERVHVGQGNSFGLGGYIIK